MQIRLALATLQVAPMPEATRRVIDGMNAGQLMELVNTWMNEDVDGEPSGKSSPSSA